MNLRDTLKCPVIDIASREECNKHIVNDTGIWMPVRPGVYQLVISKEAFIEAYNQWIKED